MYSPGLSTRTTFVDKVFGYFLLSIILSPIIIGTSVCIYEKYIDKTIDTEEEAIQVSSKCLEDKLNFFNLKPLKENHGRYCHPVINLEKFQCNYSFFKNSYQYYFSEQCDIFIVDKKCINVICPKLNNFIGIK